jgi:hypothetical protein
MVKKTILRYSPFKQLKLLHGKDLLLNKINQSNPGLRSRRRRPHLGGGAAADDEQPRGAADGGRGQVHDCGGRPGRRRKDKLSGVLPPHGAQLRHRRPRRLIRPPEQGRVMKSSSDDFKMSSLLVVFCLTDTIMTKNGGSSLFSKLVKRVQDAESWILCLFHNIHSFLICV